MGKSVNKRIDSDILAELEICREIIGVTSINRVIAFCMPVIKKACMMEKLRTSEELIAKIATHGE